MARKLLFGFVTILAVALLLWGCGDDTPTPPEATDFPGLAAFLEGCHVFVGVDSAPLHMAHLFGKPVVALFGPTNPALFGPFLCDNAVVRVDLPCSPCATRGCEDRRCMEEISVDRVLQATKGLLARGGAGPFGRGTGPSEITETL